MIDIVHLTSTAKGSYNIYMYFIQPTRNIPYLDQVINTLPSVQMIQIDDIDLYDPTIIAIADVQDYLIHQWNVPTIVMAFENEGTALAQAWELGALAGWIFLHQNLTVRELCGCGLMFAAIVLSQIL